MRWLLVGYLALASVVAAASDGERGGYTDETAAPVPTTEASAAPSSEGDAFVTREVEVEARPGAAHEPVDDATSELLERLMDQFLEHGAVSFDTLDEETAALLTAALTESSLEDLVAEALDVDDEMDVIDKDMDAVNALDKDDGDSNSHEEGHADADSEDDLEPSEAFIQLEDEIYRDGYTSELVARLEALVQHAESPRDSIFALEHLAYRQLFEPQARQPAGQDAQDDDDAFLNALAQLRMAADAGVRSAKGVVALLELIDVQFPPQDYDNVHDAHHQYELRTSRDRRHLNAERTLIRLADQDDMVASLAVGYRHLSRKLLVRQSTTPCEDAAWYYHRCAQENVLAMEEEGGERFYDVVRLSGESVFPEFTSGYDGELRDRVEAANELEYYRSVANNPLDEQFAVANERLGEMLYFGDDAAGVRPDLEAAARHFRIAAEQGEPMAMANLGMMLASGLGVAQDNASALAYFEKAAMYGSAFALHGLGVMYLTGSGVPANATRARLFFEEAVEWGFTESHTYLGSMYLDGEGVDAIDYARAFEHFELAAQSQSSQALFNLGVMHYEGIGTPVSCQEAVDLFRTAALQPDQLTRHAPFSLVKGYESYREGDLARAYLHFRLAGELGDEDALCNAAFLLEQAGDDILRRSWLSDGDEGDKKTPLHEAFALYETAAALNDSEAVRKLGACHDEPWSGVCALNRSRALEFYARAASLGDPEAAYTCGAMLLMGDDTSEDESTVILRDWPKAREFFAMCRAAEFPRNVPCALATAAMDAVLTAQALLRLVWWA